MRARFAIVIIVTLSLGGCWGSRAPLNPPRLVTSGATDMSVQLFMQATILLSNYYGYTTVRYADLQARSATAGFNIIPFMPPETVRATPELVNFFNFYEGDRGQLDSLLAKYGGYKILLKYYIRTGLRASQSICRNYLLNLEERNAYLEFLQREFAVAMTLASGILLIVNANNTLTQSFLLGTTTTNAAIDAYQEFRFLNVDRDAALTLVETAQNKLAEHFLSLVDTADANSNVTAGGYTFSDALHAVSLIEHQCTRTGIRHLLTRSISNSPSNLVVDQITGTFQFRSAKERTRSGGESVENFSRTKKPAVAPPLPPPSGPIGRAPGRVVVVTPPAAPPPGEVMSQPPPSVQVDPAAAGVEMRRFYQPGGAGTPDDPTNRAHLESLLLGLTAPKPPPRLLQVLTDPGFVDLRMRLYTRFKGL
jgi:hypothetical protein